jgi:hypothetical protein
VSKHEKIALGILICGWWLLPLAIAAAVKHVNAEAKL